MSTPKLDAVPNKDQYKSLRGKQAKLGRYVVTVMEHRRSGRQGSYERGLKFTEIVYGILQRKNPVYRYGYGVLYSANHGQSWHENLKEACRAKGKVVLKRDSHKEMAFDSIQAINRKWEGPGYVWRP